MIDFKKAIYGNRRFKILKNLERAKKGTFVQCRVDSNGVPLDEFWRERLADGDIKMLSFDDEKVAFENKKTTVKTKEEIKEIVEKNQKKIDEEQKEKTKEK